MTAQILHFPTGGRADDTIRRTIDALMKGKGVRSEVVADAAGMSRSTFFNKMAGRGTKQAFKAGEVAMIAEVLGVSVTQLYDGLGGTFVPPDDPRDGNSTTGEYGGYTDESCSNFQRDRETGLTLVFPLRKVNPAAADPRRDLAAA